MIATLTNGDREAITAAMVRQLMAENRESLQLLTLAQVCGLLNVDGSRVKRLPIPRCTITPGHYRYRAADVAAFINSRTAIPAKP